MERESQGSASLVPQFLMGPCGLHLIPDKPLVGMGLFSFFFFLLHSWLVVKKKKRVFTYLEVVQEAWTR